MAFRQAAVALWEAQEVREHASFMIRCAEDGELLMREEVWQGRYFDDEETESEAEEEKERRDDEEREK